MFVYYVCTQLTRSVFGELITIDLVKDGSNKVVAMENRSDYCAAYVDYIFNSSIGSQFEAFRKGFLKVCDGKVLVSFSVPKFESNFIKEL